MLKTARVVPIYKSGENTSVNNYRPIFILPIFSKIFEKIVFDQLYNYFDHFKLLSNSEFGFRKAYQHRMQLLMRYNIYMIILMRVIPLFIFFYNF